MWEDLFDEIKTVSFLSDYFNRKDWYRLPRDLKKLIEENIQNPIDSIANGVISGSVHIGENVSIGAFVVIEGPVFIGDNVEIGSHAHIRPGSVIGNNCVVGYTAGVKNSLMMDGSKISNHAFIGDSILGAKARVGGHSETGNRRFDQGEIPWSFEKGKVETGLDKLGAILGEGSRLGGAVITSPGTVIGKNTFVSSGANVSGFVPSGKFVKAKTELEIRDNSFIGELNQKSTLA